MAARWVGQGCRRTLTGRACQVPACRLEPRNQRLGGQVGGLLLGQVGGQVVGLMLGQHLGLHLGLHLGPWIKGQGPPGYAVMVDPPS